MNERARAVGRHPTGDQVRNWSRAEIARSTAWRGPDASVARRRGESDQASRGVRGDARKLRDAADFVAHSRTESGDAV